MHFLINQIIETLVLNNLAIIIIFQFETNFIL